VLILDAETQDPPQLLPQKLALMEQGADVVYAQRRSRQGDPWLKRLACAVFYRALRYLSETPIPLDSRDFRLISRRVL
jgi:dolichol-phosphate mannosyltransferase